MSRPLIPPGLWCVACRRPFTGPLAPTSRAVSTDIGLVHAEGCKPLTRPEYGVMGAHRRRSLAAATALDRIEDLEWMDAYRETLAGAATRLGLTRSGLERWLHAHHYHALLERLRARESAIDPWNPGTAVA